MFTKIDRKTSKASRVRRIRAIVSGTASRPRLVIHRSLRRLSAQFIDDTKGKTLLSLLDKGLEGTPIEKAKLLGTKAGQLAKENNITTVVFDRAGYKYHGKVAAFAEAAREAGLIF